MHLESDAIDRNATLPEDAVPMDMMASDFGFTNSASASL
jgi:hypothetical protein